MTYLAVSLACIAVFISFLISASKGEEASVDDIRMEDLHWRRHREQRDGRAVRVAESAEMVRGIVAELSSKSWVINLRLSVEIPSR